MKNYCKKIFESYLPRVVYISNYLDDNVNQSYWVGSYKPMTPRARRRFKSIILSANADIGEAERHLNSYLISRKRAMANGKLLQDNT